MGESVLEKLNSVIEDFEKMSCGFKCNTCKLDKVVYGQHTTVCMLLQDLKSILV